MKPFEPYLLFLARNDMKSMTGGRCAAQVSHATSLFSADIAKLDAEAFTIPEYEKWKNSTDQACGTVIVAGVSLDQLMEITERSNEFYLANIFTDPSYAVSDGLTTHFLRVTTVSYIFVERESDILPELKALPLW